MSFTEAQKVDIRRFCGYPVFGAGPSGFVGYRFFQAYGFLEFRMSNLDPAEETVISTVYLANLNTLESAIPASGANLDTDQASVWYHNKQEVRDRINLYNYWRIELCRFLGVPLGDGIKIGTTMRIAV